MEEATDLASYDATLLLDQQRVRAIALSARMESITRPQIRCFA
jgi:hypothetical protein